MLRCVIPLRCMKASAQGKCISSPRLYTSLPDFAIVTMQSLWLVIFQMFAYLMHLSCEERSLRKGFPKGEVHFMFNVAHIASWSIDRRWRARAGNTSLPAFLEAQRKFQQAKSWRRTYQIDTDTRCGGCKLATDFSCIQPHLHECPSYYAIHLDLSNFNPTFFWRLDFSFRWKLYFSPFWSSSSGKFEEPHDFTSISQIRHDVGNRDGGGFFPSKATLEYPSSHSKFVKRAAACVVNIPVTVDNMRRARQDIAWFWRSSTFLSFFPSWKSWPRVLTVTKTWREGKDEEATF